MGDELSVEDVRLLAELDREMDSGEQKFVVHNGHRRAVSDATMKELQLVSEQTVSDAVLRGIDLQNIASLKAKIALTKAAIQAKQDAKGE